MYKIYASSRYGTELIDECKTLKEAEYLVSEYRLAYGYEFSVYYKKR